MWVGPPRCVKSQFCTRTQESVSFFEESNFPHNFFLNIVLRFDHHGRADGHVQCHALEVKLSWQDHVEKKIRWRMATLSSARVRWSQICKWCGRTDDPQCNKMKKNKSKIMDFKTGRDAADPLYSSSVMMIVQFWAFHCCSWCSWWDAWAWHIHKWKF